MPGVGLRLLMAAIVIAGEFAAFEAALRWRGGTEAAPAFQKLFMPDDRIGYRLRPGASTTFSTPEFTTDIAINEVGVRDEPIAPKAPGERRVVVLGDSLVLAVQVPLQQTFCKVLERRLNAHAAPGARYRVINAGVQGYGPIEELLFFRELAPALQPDLVLITTFVANDAVEAFDAAWRLESTRSRVVEARDETERTLRRVVRRSIVLQIARRRVQQLAEGLGRSPTPERPVATYLESPPHFITRGLEIARGAIDAIAREARANGQARTAVVLMPARFQLDPAEFGRLRAVVDPTGGRLRVDGATERFEAALAETGLPMLDMLPRFRQSPDGQFFATTVHLTARGHETVAAALETFIAERALLP
jgi:lysophospholipase L1-like esterase